MFHEILNGTLFLWDEPSFLESLGTACGLEDEHTILEIVGVLPTEDDIRLALEDKSVRAELEAIVAKKRELKERLEAWGILGDEPLSGLHDLMHSSVIDLETLQLALLREMDRASGYHHWTLLRSAFTAWPGIPEEEFPR